MNDRFDYLDIYQTDYERTGHLGYNDVLNEIEAGHSYSDDIDALALDDGIDYRSGQPPVMIR